MAPCSLTPQTTVHTLSLTNSSTNSTRNIRRERGASDSLQLDSTVHKRHNPSRRPNRAVHTFSAGNLLHRLLHCARVALAVAVDIPRHQSETRPRRRRLHFAGD